MINIPSLLICVKPNGFAYDCLTRYWKSYIQNKHWNLSAKIFSVETFNIRSLFGCFKYLKTYVALMKADTP